MFKIRQERNNISFLKQVRKTSKIIDLNITIQ